MCLSSFYPGTLKLFVQSLVRVSPRLIDHATARTRERRARAALGPNFLFRCHMGKRTRGVHQNICISADRYQAWPMHW